MTESRAIHWAAKHENGDSVSFLFAHGDEARLVGEVPSEDEYRALRVFFEGWRGVKLPEAEAPDEWVADLWKGQDRG